MYVLINLNLFLNTHIYYQVMTTLLKAPFFILSFILFCITPAFYMTILVIHSMHAHTTLRITDYRH
jgi:hypothetical protein